MGRHTSLLWWGRVSVLNIWFFWISGEWEFAGQIWTSKNKTTTTTKTSPKLKLKYFGTWWKELTHLKRPWCWERLKVGEGGDRGWDGWVASPTQWTWVWLNSGSWWWTGRPGVLQSMGSQRVGHDWVSEPEQVKKGFKATSMIKDYRFCCQAHLDTKSLGSRYPFCDHHKLQRSSISPFVKLYETLIVAMLPVKNTLVNICKMPSVRLDTQVCSKILFLL